MADVNKSVSINYTASTEGLERALKKIPNITDSEGKKAAQEIDKNFKKMEKSAESSSRAISQKMKKIGASFAAVGAGMAAVGAGVISLSQKFADLTNELVDASTKTGIAVETLAGLRLAAEGSGLAFANLEGGLIKFQSSILDASRGSANLKMTFDSLGVAIKDSDGNLRDANSVFLDSVKALGEMENLTERNALAMQLFGRQSGPALIQSGALDNLQGMTTLAREFGVAINEDAINSMGVFQRKMAEFGTVFDGTMQKVLGSIAGPNSLNYAIDGVTKAIIYMGSIASDIISVMGEGFESVFVIAESVSLAFSGKIEQAHHLMNEQSKETRQSVYNLGDIFSRASAEVDKFNSLSSQSTAPQVMESVAEASVEAVQNVEALNEEMAKLEETTSDLFDETGDIMARSLELWEKSNKFVNDTLLDEYTLQEDSIKTIGKELESHLNLVKLIKDSRQEELDILNAQMSGVDPSGSLSKEEIANFQRIEELKGNILFLTGEIDSLEGQYVSQRLSEYTQIHELRLEQMTEQRDLELKMQEEIVQSYRDKISSIEAMNNEVFSTFGEITNAFEAINNAQITNLEERMAAEIKAIEDKERSEVYSKQEATRLKQQIEDSYSQAIQEKELKTFKARQSLAVSEVMFQGAIAVARALADYGIPLGLGVAALAAAKTTAQLAVIGAQSPPKFDVGGMVGNSTDAAPDMVTANLLKGEAILDRSTVQRIGGEEGVRALQNGKDANNKTIIIQPFKHIDRYSRMMTRQSSRRVGSGAY